MVCPLPAFGARPPTVRVRRSRDQVPRGGAPAIRPRRFVTVRSRAVNGLPGVRLPAFCAKARAAMIGPASGRATGGREGTHRGIEPPPSTWRTSARSRTIRAPRRSRSTTASRPCGRSACALTPMPRASGRSTPRRPASAPNLPRSTRRATGDKPPKQDSIRQIATFANRPSRFVRWRRAPRTGNLSVFPWLRPRR